MKIRTYFLLLTPLRPVTLFLAALLWLPSLLYAADTKSEVTHGATSIQASAAEWWDIPYPSHFDQSSLTKAQDFIKIEGNRFVDEAGNTFVFRGVNIADPDKLVYQDNWNRRLFEEVAAWGANTIRLPVHPVPWRQRGSDWYFTRIDEAVRWANELGLYLIIDWHSIGNLNSQMFQHPMYNTSMVETREFWRSIAYRYKGVPTLAVYELFNEPTDNFIGVGEGSLGKLNWESWRVSLEEIIDVVQVYDAGVISLVGGMNWAYSLEPVAELPVRREQVAYASHAYPQKAKPDVNTQEAYFDLWQKNWGYVAETYPIIATEIGWVREDGFNSHVPVINNDGSYGPNLVNFMEERGISWTVWNFDTDWAPVMISDWNFTPSEQGRFFRDVMLRAKAGSLTSSVIASPRVTEYEWMSMERWRQMHAEDSSIAEKNEVDLLFIGDSITEGWPDEIWKEHFSAHNAANFGIGGDKTQNLLWRLQNGAVGQLDPSVVVLLIGVNNFGLGDDGPQDVYLGVEAVISKVRAAWADADIVLLGILPYGKEADTAERREVTQTNVLLSGLAEDPRVSFHDIGQAFLQSDGTISPEIMEDYLHPTEKGYAVFARELEPILAPLLD